MLTEKTIENSEEENIHMKINILIVCSGNICRSPMAEGLLKKKIAELNLESAINVTSAGTLGIVGSSASENAVIASHTEYDVDLSWHESKAVDYDLVTQSNLILSMDKENHHFMVDHYLEELAFCKLDLIKSYAGIENENMDVSDPVGNDLTEYVKSCHEIAQLVDLCMKRILSEFKLKIEVRRIYFFYIKLGYLKMSEWKFRKKNHMRR